MSELLSYSQLILLPTFKERFEYCRLCGKVGKETFGGWRELNQEFYKSDLWKECKKDILLRDNFCDLAHPDYEIRGSIYVHHLNPLTYEDLLYLTDRCFDPDNLVSVSFSTHQAITYGLSGENLYQEPIVRTANDTCPWK